MWHGHPEILLPPHWIPNIIGSECCQSDDACMPLDQSAVNLTMPVCHWIRVLSIWRCLYAIGSECCQSDDACMPLDQSTVNPTMPVCHWIRVLSIWRCLYAIGSERCYCCLIVACVHIGISPRPSNCLEAESDIGNFLMKSQVYTKEN